MRGRPSPARSADNDLYDHGADLVEAARSIRLAASSPEVTRAVPAVMGCVETALRDLTAAIADLERAVSASAGGEPPSVREARMRRGFANAHVALHDAAEVVAAARGLTARALDVARRGGP